MKNIVKIGLVTLVGVVMTSCTLKLSAVTPTQNYNADITIIPVEEYKK